MFCCTFQDKHNNPNDNNDNNDNNAPPSEGSIFNDLFKALAYCMTTTSAYHTEWPPIATNMEEVKKSEETKEVKEVEDVKEVEKVKEVEPIESCTETTQHELSEKEGVSSDTDDDYTNEGFSEECVDGFYIPHVID